MFNWFEQEAKKSFFHYSLYSGKQDSSLKSCKPGMHRQTQGDGKQMHSTTDGCSRSGNVSATSQQHSTDIMG